MESTGQQMSKMIQTVTKWIANVADVISAVHESAELDRGGWVGQSNPSVAS